MITESQEQEHFKNAINTIHPRFRNIARKSYEKARSSGQTHAAAMTNMRTLFTEETEMDEEQLDELSNDTLASYKKKAGDSARSLDKAADVEFAARNTSKGVALTKDANARFKGVVKATNKQFDNDKKLREETERNTFEEVQKILSKRKVAENVIQSSKEGKIAKGSNNTGKNGKMMGNKSPVETYLRLLSKE